LAQRRVGGSDFTQAGEWMEFRLPFTVTGKKAEDVEFRVEYLGAAELSFDEVRLTMTRQMYTAAMAKAMETDGPLVVKRVFRASGDENAPDVE
ncbi:MAG: hypothetical protein OEZ04_14130, partial [Nitrospinota bacterium]|nr:hypothetical protein [Nitrospinota bacterium]